MIRRHCWRCWRWVWVWPWRNRLCRDFASCVAERLVYEIENGVLDEPEPLWFEQAPDDIDVCSMCKGRGEVFREDWESGLMPTECPRCEGSEVDPTRCR